MRRVPSGVALLAILGGLAALAVPASDSAFAAKGCNGMSPVCANGASGPQTYDNAFAAKAAGARVEHPGACHPLFCVALYLHARVASDVRDGSAQSRPDDLSEQLRGRAVPRDLAL